MTCVKPNSSTAGSETFQETFSFFLTAKVKNRIRTRKVEKELDANVSDQLSGLHERGGALPQKIMRGGTHNTVMFTCSQPEIFPEYGLRCRDDWDWNKGSLELVRGNDRPTVVD